MLNTQYIGLIRASIRRALKMRLNYYEFNWYLLGTKNGYRYVEKLPTQEEILYADRLIDKVTGVLFNRKGWYKNVRSTYSINRKIAIQRQPV